ncbi:MAG: hypothetical protein Q4F21_13715 [Lachnospiraceae bacterium]|nr:hypothetical protein [Lachnospiraceae bacterium]
MYSGEIRILITDTGQIFKDVVKRDITQRHAGLNSDSRTADFAGNAPSTNKQTEDQAIQAGRLGDNTIVSDRK